MNQKSREKGCLFEVNEENDGGGENVLMYKEKEEIIEFRENTITIDEYLKLRNRVGWKPLSREQAQLALEHSLITIGAYLADQLIGMGRIVGDGAVICYVQDLIIPPQAQSFGIGSMILRRLEAYVESIRIPGTEMMFDLMCAKGREAFYVHHGFIARPTPKLGPGMIKYLTDNEPNN